MTPLHLATEAARAVGFSVCDYPLEIELTLRDEAKVFLNKKAKGKSQLDAFAFRHLRPVLLAAGCMIEDFDYGAYVREPDSPLYPRTYSCISHSGNDDGAPVNYFTALATAILYLRDNAPEALAAAVEKAGRG